MKTILMSAVIMSIGTSSVMFPLTAFLSQDGAPAQSQPPVPAPVPETETDGPAPLAPLPEALQEVVKGATPLNPDSTVFLDVKGKRTLLRTEVACRNCILEMLCVPEGVKEHETILRIRSGAWVVHTGLVGMGVEPGKPVKFSPTFVPPAGTTIRIYANWIDEQGKVRREDVRNWIRHNVHKYFAAPLPSPPPGLELPYKELRYDRFNRELLWYGPMSAEQRDDLLGKWDNEVYQKAIRKFFDESQSKKMDAEFVFAGSGFYKDPETGKEYYQAEGGYMICVANFADAMIDVRENSTSSDGSQTYEAWTEQIPPEKTPVILELVAEAASEKAESASEPQQKAEPAKGAPGKPQE